MSKCTDAVPSAKDMRECARCGESIAVVGGRLAHVSKQHAMADREAAHRRFLVRSTPKDGLRVTVAGAGAAEGSETPLTGPGDGQNGRSVAGGGDGSQSDEEHRRA